MPEAIDRMKALVRRAATVLALALVPLGAIGWTTTWAQAPSPNAGAKDDVPDTGTSGEVLKDTGCGREAQLRSLNANVATKVVVLNRTPGPVVLYWLDYRGKRTFYAEIAPGRGREQPTFVTHPWLVTDKASGRCLSLFEPLTGIVTAVVR